VQDSAGQLEAAVPFNAMESRMTVRETASTMEIKN
jgi:hypothetical protein